MPPWIGHASPHQQEPRKQKLSPTSARAWRRSYAYSSPHCLLRRLRHGLRILHDVDGEYGQSFVFGSKAAAAGRRDETLDRSFDDYENEISRVEFEPEIGTAYRRDGGGAGAWPGRGGGTPPASGSMKGAAAVDDAVVPAVPNRDAGLGMPLPGIRQAIGWGAPAPPARSAGSPRRRGRQGPEHQHKSSTERP
ncbi:hypothetical protein GUJ93_ZPchr0013g34630 [Zizania palustris]|uniref:Uncharacterized protein n=1 Tax=Zizania palustris TaxID=103762 RepID=A0A8J5WUU4_ZIZPA|nr:hypothetical protein GUJ93_ZPchr0013g34630 [Zizania palustris]